MEKSINPDKVRVYRLLYRQGAKIEEKHFNFTGNLKDAIQRGRDHCSSMGFTFIHVNPFIVDLEHQEKLRGGVDDAA